jgi:hypothetical protein
MQQAIVEIKKPCHEILENRKPGAKGNYCNSCQTVVIDFTNKTPEEISRYLMKNETVHCGTFNRKDVSTGSPVEHFISWLQNRRLKPLAFVVLTLVLLVSCRTRGAIKRTSNGSSRPLDAHTPSIENLK